MLTVPSVVRNRAIVVAAEATITQVTKPGGETVRGAEERAEDGDADGPADLAGRVEGGGRGAVQGGLDGGDGLRRHGRHEQTRS